MFEGKRRGGEGGARVLLLDVLDMEYSEGEPKIPQKIFLKILGKYAKTYRMPHTYIR